MKKLTTIELKKRIEAGDILPVDVRPIDAYNGWRLNGEKRGGHIKTAKSMPLKWTGYFDWIEIVRAKNISTSQKIVVYGYNEKQSRLSAGFFQRAGFKDIALYDDFMEWSANDELPMERLPRFKNLVPAQWVKSLIAGERPEEYDNDRFVIVHAHYRNRDAYLSGHIPGAIDMDTLALESPETWNRRSPRELKKALEQHGITADTTVVVYGKYLNPDNADDFPGSAAGHIGAIRSAFIMLYAGVKDVRVLNGGFQSWKDEGYETATDDVPKTAVKEFGGIIPLHPELAVDMAEAKRMLASDDAALVCVRSRPEYLGEVSGYNYIDKKGRIPGDVFGNCGTDAYHMENYRNVDHTTREYGEIAENWKSVGITPDKHLAFYCGTGWRGSEAWFNAWLMGWPRVSVFDGGWFEWSNDPKNPFETGIPEK